MSGPVVQVVDRAPKCGERGCEKRAACEACRCCDDHCPGHTGLLKSLKLKTGQAPRVDTAKPKESDYEYWDEALSLEGP
jgi:hypothetical protein